MLTRAVDQFQASGARRGERRVDAALRDLGVARGRRDSRSRPATGWDALTPTELKVARLAAEGLTNPEIGRRLFISPRTVETHLSHAYAKLGVSSRVALAGIAASVS
jgi:DNA-binding CsgD family transcriptional regulator